MGVNSTNPDLIGATSVYPWKGTFVCPPGDVVDFGLPTDADGLTFMLAGVDICVGPAQDSPWLVQLWLLPVGIPFWQSNPNLGYSTFELGGYASYRGSIILAPLEDVQFSFSSEDDTNPNASGIWWGYWIPYGWTPVGVPPQQ